MKKFKNKKILLFLLILIIIGFLSGIFFVFFIKDIDIVMVKSAIESYINNINSNKYSYINGIFNSLKINLLYITIIWCMGIVFIFSPIIYFINLYKGFLLGFLVSSLVSIYSIKGILYSIVFIFPHVIINILLCLSLSIISLKYGKRLHIKIKNGESINLKNYSNKYIKIYGIYIIISIISSVLEVFLNTFLIRLVV